MARTRQFAALRHFLACFTTLTTYDQFILDYLFEIHSEHVLLVHAYTLNRLKLFPLKFNSSSTSHELASESLAEHYLVVLYVPPEQLAKR